MRVTQVGIRTTETSERVQVYTTSNNIRCCTVNLCTDFLVMFFVQKVVSKHKITAEQVCFRRSKHCFVLPESFVCAETATGATKGF